MFKVYALYNKKNDKIYIGQTNNLENRLALHHDKKIKKSYTAHFDGTWALIYQERAEDRLQALKREKQLKSYRGRQFIKNLIIPG